jgi:hypothetical protein
MTTDDFRRIALSMPETEESSGMGYPSFRAGRKSFATIEDSIAVIRLTRDQQAMVVAAAPEVFTPVSGGWGLLGRTIVQLEMADETTVQEALATAWSNVVDAEPRDHLQTLIDRLHALGRSRRGRRLRP